MGIDGINILFIRGHQHLLDELELSPEVIEQFAYLQEVKQEIKKL